MKGLWKPHDARLIERVGGSCDEPGQDDGDVSELKTEALSNKDINKPCVMPTNAFMNCFTMPG